MNNSAAGNPASTHRPPQGDGHHNQGLVLNLVVASVLCPAFATIFVLLRFYTCRAIIKRIHTDDCKLLSRLASHASIISEQGVFLTSFARVNTYRSRM